MYFHSINAPEYKHDNYIINDYMYGIGRTYHTLINIIEKIFNIQNIHNSRPINVESNLWIIFFNKYLLLSLFFNKKNQKKFII